MSLLRKAVLLASVLLTFSGPAHGEKAIVGTVELLPNYLWHLFAVSDVFDRKKSEYADRYRGTIEADDAAFLHEHRDLVAWGNSVTNFFTVFLFFAPAARSFETKAALERYLEMVQMGFDDRFEAYVREFPRLISDEQVSGLLARKAHYAKVFRRFAGIVLKYFDSYRENVWPDEARSLQSAAESVTRHFRGRGLIERWETRLKLTFPGERLSVVLTTANRNLPTANNLTRTRYNFYFQPDDLKALFELISHEIGTNLLHPVKAELDANAELRAKIEQAGLTPLVTWRAFETLAEHHNGAILGIPPTVWTGKMFNGEEYDFPVFFAFYSMLYQDRPTISAHEALQAGIAHYIGVRGKR